MKYSIHNEAKVKEVLNENGFPTFRYAQIENAIYKNYIQDFQEI
jgi:adenine C2-methylase RlmN of 23S rRNA A2503 and tRNA A37